MGANPGDMHKQSSLLRAISWVAAIVGGVIFLTGCVGLFLTGGQSEVVDPTVALCFLVGPAVGVLAALLRAKYLGGSEVLSLRRTGRYRVEPQVSVERRPHVPAPPLARRAAIAGLVTLVLALAGFLVGEDRSETFDLLHGLCIFLTPVMALIAVIAQARAREAAERDRLAPQERIAHDLGRKARWVTLAIAITAMAVGGGARSVAVVVSGVLVLTLWLVWTYADANRRAQ